MIKISEVDLTALDTNEAIDSDGNALKSNRRSGLVVECQLFVNLFCVGVCFEILNHSTVELIRNFKSF